MRHGDSVTKPDYYYYYYFKSADKITPRNFDSSCFSSETLSIMMLAERFFLPKIMNVVLEKIFLEPKIHQPPLTIQTTLNVTNSVSSSEQVSVVCKHNSFKFNRHESLDHVCRVKTRVDLG